MPSILLPSRYTQQPTQAPQIDWSNPITRGLVFAYVATAVGLAGYGSNGANDLPFVATYGPQFGNAIGAALATPQGYGAKALIAGNPIVTLPDFSAAQSSSFSLFALATGPASGTQSAIDDDDGTTRRYQFRLNAGKVEFIPFSSGGSQTLTLPAALTSAELARGFAMGASAGPGRYAVLQNSQIASATPGGSLLTPTAKPSIGARKSGTQQWGHGGLSLLCNWARTLSDAELLSLSANPWQIFKAPARRLWFAASSPTGAVLDGTASGEAFGSGALSTSIPLAGAAGAQASGTGALTTSIQLAGSAVAQASGSGTIPGGAASLVGSAIAAASGSATLSTSVLMAGAATAQASAAAALTTSISLAGAAVAQASAANLSMSPAPRVYAATIMRITTTNRRADLGAVLNVAAPIRSTGPNVATILSAAPVNRAADLGPATLNRTVSFP